MSIKTRRRVVHEVPWAKEGLAKDRIDTRSVGSFTLRPARPSALPRGQSAGRAVIAVTAASTVG
jgi:hypothetical protein